jgi:hypothetical protein
VTDVQDLNLLSLETGDVLLFSGRGPVSAVIRVFTRSPWSHIGLVVRLPGYPEPLVLEAAGGGDSADLHLGRPVAGVTLVPLARKLANYAGDVAVRRRLGPPLSEARQRLARRLVARLLHRPYKNYLWCNVRDLLTGFTRPPDRRGWFCSELVAEFYRRLGWLPRDVRVSGFVPGHFGSTRLTLLDGTLLPPQFLKRGRRGSATEPPKASAAPVADTLATAPRTAAREKLLPRRSRGYA